MKIEERMFEAAHLLVNVLGDGENYSSGELAISLLGIDKEPANGTTTRYSVFVEGKSTISLRKTTRPNEQSTYFTNAAKPSQYLKVISEQAKQLPKFTKLPDFDPIGERQILASKFSQSKGFGGLYWIEMHTQAYLSPALRSGIACLEYEAFEMSRKWWTDLKEVHERKKLLDSIDPAKIDYAVLKGAETRKFYQSSYPEKSHA